MRTPRPCFIHAFAVGLLCALAASASAGVGRKKARYVIGGGFLSSGEPLRVRYLVDVLAALPALREDDPALYRKIEEALLRHIPDQAGPLTDYLATYSSSACRKRQVLRNRGRTDFRDFYRGTVVAGERLRQACAGLKRGDRGEALARLEEAVVLDPKFADAYIHRAIIRSLQEEAGKADLDYREGVKILPDEPPLEAGDCLCSPELAAEAGRLATRVSRGQADKGDGIALFLKGDHAAAESRLSAAIASTPGDAEVFQSRAVVREALGNWRGAMADYEKAAELFARWHPPSRDSVLRNLARLRAKEAELARAKEAELVRAKEAELARAKEAELVRVKEAELARAKSSRPGSREKDAASPRKSPEVRSPGDVVEGPLGGTVRSRATKTSRTDVDAVAGQTVRIRAAKTSPGAPVTSPIEETSPGALSGWPVLSGALRRLGAWKSSRQSEVREIFLAAREVSRRVFVAESHRTGMLNPVDGAVFPADIRSPELRWADTNPKNRVWLLQFSFRDSKHDFNVFSKERRWTPPAEVWENIKLASRETPAELDVYGLESEVSPLGVRSHVEFQTSEDPVGAPVFFRAVPNPFPPSEDFVKVKWKLGWVSSYEPPITVMEKQSRCFNCHVTSFDGKHFGFDFNAIGGGDRSGYLYFNNPGKEVELRWDNYFDWRSFDPKTEGEAFSSAISPDGRYIATGGMAKVNVNISPCKDCLAFSIFTKGIILYYSTEDKVIKALAGADDERYVHLVWAWSPDGKYIYFTRAPITPQYEEFNRKPLIDEAAEKYENMGWRELDKIFVRKNDIYRIPFNEGKGGAATPVRGASANGRSNFFPRPSPDGKWIVFTQAANGMATIREDSDLYIIPAEGGAARRLGANGPGGDSWHSWAPNGRWLVFASKSYQKATDLVLTHIDEEGRDSPPVILTQMRDEDGLSANLPEFFNIKPGQFEKLIPNLPGVPK